MSTTPQFEDALAGGRGQQIQIEIPCGEAPSAAYVLTFTLKSVARKPAGMFQQQRARQCNFCGRNGYIAQAGGQCGSCGMAEPTADTLTVQLCVSALEMYGTAKVPVDAADDAAAAALSPGRRRGSGGGGGAGGRGYVHDDDY